MAYEEFNDLVETILDKTGRRKFEEWEEQDFTIFLESLNIQKDFLNNKWKTLTGIQFFSQSFISDKLKEFLNKDNIGTEEIGERIMKYREALMKYYNIENSDIIKSFLIKKNRKVAKNTINYYDFVQGYKLSKNPFEIFSTESNSKPDPPDPLKDFSFLWNINQNNFYRIENRLTTLGRDTKNNLPLNVEKCPSISRIHATIRYDSGEGCYFLRDEGSTFGTYVQIKSLELTPVSCYYIEVGSTLIFIEPTNLNPKDDCLEFNLSIEFSKKMPSPEIAQGKISMKLKPGEFIRFSRRKLKPNDSKSNDFFIEDPDVSEGHARIFHEPAVSDKSPKKTQQGEAKPSRLVFEDLKSKNGSFLKLHREHRLVKNEIIRFGENGYFSFILIQEGDIKDYYEKDCSSCSDKPAVPLLYFPCSHLSTSSCEECYKRVKAPKSPKFYCPSCHELVLKEARLQKTVNEN